MRPIRLLTFATAVAVLVAGLALVPRTSAGPKPPSSAQIDFAVEASDLMLATLFAALTQEFDETTPANVEQGKLSISLIFNDKNRDMRLVGTLAPLGDKAGPQDAFEEAALALALTGANHEAVDHVDGQWYFRRSIALSNFRSECALCHTNFPPGPTADWVGALMLRVPIPK
jgi:hypothetical protein